MTSAIRRRRRKRMREVIYLDRVEHDDARVRSG